MTTESDLRLDHLFIGGEWVRPSTDRMIDVVMPSTETVYARVAEADERDIDRAVAAARAAFDEGPWRRMSHAERGALVRALGTELEAQVEDVVRIWTSEMGIARRHALGSAAMAFDGYRIYADLADTFPFHERHAPRWGAGFGMLVREPVGVVGAIIPWNAPPVLIAYKIAPALVAGCTVVLKSSPEAPIEGYMVADIAQKLGFPAGVLNVVTAEREASERLVRHPDVDKITFTGSTAAGRRIASLCGERVARCTLELGGKSAAVVLDDYPVEDVARAMALSTPSLTGQVCAAITRVVVGRDRHDALVEALSAEFERIRVGDPFLEETEMGPLAMRRQRDRVEQYIASGVASGARLATGGRRPREMNRGFYIEPTVFGDVDNGSAIAREEIFGPVVSVIPAASETEAVAIANDSIFGLNASVFTHDIDRAYAVSRELRSGTVGHNAFMGDFSIAFGGFKQSGIGREGGRDGLLPFLEAKTLLLDRAPAAVSA